MTEKNKSPKMLERTKEQKNDFTKSRLKSPKMLFSDQKKLLQDHALGLQKSTLYVTTKKSIGGLI